MWFPETYRLTHPAMTLVLTVTECFCLDEASLNTGDSSRLLCANRLLFHWKLYELAVQRLDSGTIFNSSETLTQFYSLLGSLHCNMQATWLSA